MVADADATDTVVLSAHSSPAYRVMRTPFSESLEKEASVVMGRTVGIDGVLKLYFEGDLDAGFAFGGQVAGRVSDVLPVRQIIRGTVSEFYEAVSGLGRFLPDTAGAPNCSSTSVGPNASIIASGRNEYPVCSQR